MQPITLLMKSSVINNFLRIMLSIELVHFASLLTKHKTYSYEKINVIKFNIFIDQILINSDSVL